MLVLCIIEAFKLDIILSLCKQKQTNKQQKKYTAYPSLKWLTFVQYKHDPKVKVVRVNGQITEVKKTMANSNMGDHLFCLFFNLATVSKNIRQICQILQLSWNFGKTQLRVQEIICVYEVFFFFNLATVSKNIRQICQILQLSWNFGKIQLCV